MYNWKKYQHTNQRIERRVSVTKSDAIGFPTQNYKDNNIKDYKYVSLYFDQEQMALAIKLTNDEAEHDKLTIVHSKKGYGGQVLARNFFRTYNIDSKKYAHKYDYEKIKDPTIGEVLVIKLKENAEQQVEA